MALLFANCKHILRWVLSEQLSVNTIALHDLRYVLVHTDDQIVCLFLLLVYLRLELASHLLPIFYVLLVLFLNEFFQRFGVLLHFRIQLSDQSGHFTFCRASFFIDLVLALLDLEEDLLPKCFVAPLEEVKPLTHLL